MMGKVAATVAVLVLAVTAAGLVGQCACAGTGADAEEEPKRVKAKWLTHEKPEPADTWERIEGDCTRDPRSQCAERMCGAAQMDDSECIEAWAKDLVLRAKALAERGAE